MITAAWQPMPEKPCLPRGNTDSPIQWCLPQHSRKHLLQSWTFQFESGHMQMTIGPRHGTPAKNNSRECKKNLLFVATGSRISAPGYSHTRVRATLQSKGSAAPIHNPSEN